MTIPISGWLKVRDLLHVNASNPLHGHCRYVWADMRRHGLRLNNLRYHLHCRRWESLGPLCP